MSLQKLVIPITDLPNGSMIAGATIAMVKDPGSNGVEFVQETSDDGCS